ncbi:MAG: dihydrofolate reductase [Bacteroidota bacterium]
MPEVVVIAAVAESDRLIGDGLELPWHIPADLKRFKALTVGHPLIMGRKTFESLVHQFGGPLPNRENVVLTRQPDRVTHPGARVFTSFPEALAAFPDAERVFIGGGAGVYESALTGQDGVEADRLELTLVEGEFSGDTFFPPYRHLLDAQGGPFRCVSEEVHPSREGVPAFRFMTYVRDNNPA